MVASHTRNAEVQSRASRGFSAIADLKNSAFALNYGTTRRWSSRDVEMLTALTFFEWKWSDNSTFYGYRPVDWYILYNHRTFDCFPDPIFDTSEYWKLTRDCCKDQSLHFKPVSTNMTNRPQSYDRHFNYMYTPSIVTGVFAARLHCSFENVLTLQQGLSKFDFAYTHNIQGGPKK